MEPASTKRFIPVNTPRLDGNEKRYVSECLETGWISSEGPYVTRFEEKFAESTKRKYGIAVCNGSAALDIAIVALNIGKGDEVILPAFTIISCAAAIVRAGAVPVVVDSCPITWNMKIEDVRSKITKRTRAIMPVHIYGLPVDMDPLLHLANEFNLHIIEDAAEAHGLHYKDRICGSFGTISSFSFYPNKHITTGEGGMLVTNDPAVAERCRSLRNLCFKAEKRFYHEELGWNMRMTNLQAALGLAQLEQLDRAVETKRKLGEFYTEQFRDLKDIQIPTVETSYAKNIYWVFGMVLGDSYRMNAVGAMKKLAEAGVGTRPFFYPMHQQPVLKKMGFFSDQSTFPVSERLAERGFYIPSGLGLKEEDMTTVAEQVRAVLSS